MVQIKTPIPNKERLKEFERHQTVPILEGQTYKIIKIGMIHHSFTASVIVIHLSEPVALF